MEPQTIVHEMSPQDRMLRMMGGGAMGGRSNPALAVAGVAAFLGGGCILAGGIVQAVITPAAPTLSGSYATDTAGLQTYLTSNTQAQFVGGILYAIGGGLGVIGGGAGIVAGMARR